MDSIQPVVYDMGELTTTVSGFDRYVGIFAQKLTS